MSRIEWKEHSGIWVNLATTNEKCTTAQPAAFFLNQKKQALQSLRTQ